jgi:Fe2+ or Zn2+ uptake regulation protein
VRTTEELTEQFRAQGLRVTPQRQAIFGLLQDNTSHPTVDAIHEAARVQMPMLSLKTVYQTVNDLEAMGEVLLLDVGTGGVRVDPNTEEPHQHLVCRQCGRVRDVHVDVGNLRLDARDRRGFTVAGVDVQFRGVCDECSSAMEMVASGKDGDRGRPDRGRPDRGRPDRGRKD